MAETTCRACLQEIPADYTETHPGPYHDSCCPDCAAPLDDGAAAIRRELDAVEDDEALLGVAYPEPDAPEPG